MSEEEQARNDALAYMAGMKLRDAHLTISPKIGARSEPETPASEQDAE